MSVITLEIAEELVAALKAGDEMSAQMIVSSLSEPDPESELYNGVGKLTRKVYEAVKDFALDEKLATNASELPKTQSDIDYIVATAENSANSTIAAIETILPKLEPAHAESEEIEKDIDRFLAKQMSFEEFSGLIERIKSHTVNTRVLSTEITTHLNDVLMAQGFQDLTGQVAQRISLVMRDIESNLLELLQIYGTEVKETHEDPASLSGPSINPNSEGVVSNQDDVDDLLSSLGF